MMFQYSKIPSLHYSILPYGIRYTIFGFDGSRGMLHIEQFMSATLLMFYKALHCNSNTMPNKAENHTSDNHMNSADPQA